MAVAHIQAPHLSYGFIVAKVGIARKRDRSLPNPAIPHRSIPP